MPISSIPSYLNVSQQFIDHWTQVNAALGATPLVLKGNYALATFTADRASLQIAITTVAAQISTYNNAATARDQRKSAIKPRIAQFRAAAIYFVPDSVYVGALPKTPSSSAAEGPFTAPLDSVATVWGQINADLGVPGFTPPMLLVAGYNKATFDTELTALRTAYRTLANAEDSLRIARGRRDVLLSPLKTRMVQYRNAVLARFGVGNALTISLPKITPDAGSTPLPMTLSVSWDAQAGKAKLSWTPSSDARLSRYEVRYCPPPRYKATEEQSIPGADIVPPATQFLTDFALGSSGSQALFKVYVITSDDNEKGSNSVRITRP